MDYKKVLFKNMPASMVIALGVVFTSASLIFKNIQLSFKVAMFFISMGFLSFLEYRAGKKSNDNQNSSFNSKAHKFYFWYICAVLIAVIIFAIGMTFFA